MGFGESTQAREPQTYNSPPLSCSTLKNKLSDNYFSFDSLILSFQSLYVGEAKLSMLLEVLRYKFLCQEFF